MAQTNKVRNDNVTRLQIIDIVKTPLGFFVLAVLVLETGLGIAAGIGEGNNQKIALIGMLSLFALLIIVVGILTYWKPQALLGSRFAEGLQMSIAFGFPDMYDPSDLNFKECTYSFANPRRPEEKKTGVVLPYPAGAGWVCPLPPQMKPGYTIDLAFTDDSGKEWVAKRFVPELHWPLVNVQPKGAQA